MALQHEARPHLGAWRQRHAGNSPAARLLLLVAAVATALQVVAAARGATPAGRLQSPSAAEISRAAGEIPDSTAVGGLLAARAFWGGVYTASTGEQVTVRVSPSYPEDPAIAQRWADFLAGLVHGPELSSVILYLAPPAEVQSICGRDALACYGASANLLVAPGDDPTTTTSAEAVVTHEYGHHVASQRSNPPWQAVDYGTKRWASYVQICASAVGGRLFPGAEQLPHYQLNPGEGFAESYRVLNERAAGIPEAPWEIVSRQLYPDDTALAALRADVLTPWQSTTTTTSTSTLSKTAPARTYTVSTPLDGTLDVTLRLAAGTRAGLVVSGGDATVLARGSGTRTLAATTTICGRRTVQLRVTRISGAGTFRLTVDRP